MNEIQQSNAAYWDEPCGTTRLDHLGLSARDTSPSALGAFDKFFFEFYPYLHRYIPFDALQGKDVLEVGLGMGSVSQRIAESGARFRGLDIARGPVDLVNIRLQRLGFAETAQQGSILQAPFADETFDHVISIGCLHHTGDLPRAISEVHRVLKKGGTAILMLYYAYSPKRWLLWPLATAHHLLASWGAPDRPVAGTASERAGYDRATDGGAPPETVFTSKRQLRALGSRFEGLSMGLENLDTDMLLYPFSRPARQMIRPSLLGLGSWTGAASEDLYAVLRK
jgi:SAM-dependent methyltransferase